MLCLLLISKHYFAKYLLNFVTYLLHKSGSLCVHTHDCLNRCGDNILPFLGVPVNVTGPVSALVSGAAASSAATLRVAL